MVHASQQLIALLGQPFDGKAIRDLLAGFEVKRVAAPNSPLSESIVWIAKASVRIDVYRPQQLSRLTGSACAAQADWLIGSVELLAPGSDSRMRKETGPAWMSICAARSPRRCSMTPIK